MRRNKQLFFVLIFPYFLAGYVVLSLFGSDILSYLDDLFPKWGMLPLTEIGFCMAVICYIIALISAIVTLVLNQTRRDETALEILRTNMIIKLAQIPAYIIIFLLGVATIVTVVLMGASIFIFAYDVLSILLTGLVGVSGVIKACREKKISLGAGILCGWMQFVFCLDVISAVVLYVKMRKKEKIS